jgi:V8-like Glu-specific endopeptidase
MAASDDGQDMPGYNPHQQQQKQQLAFKQQLQLGQEGKLLQKQHRSKPEQRDYLLDIVSYGRKLLLAPLSSQDTSALQRSLKYIIGQDDRFEVTDIPQWPFTAVGQFLYKNGSCSGVMIGPRSVLTAGHCVFNRKKQLWQQDIVFIPGRCGMLPGQSCRCTAVPAAQYYL